MCFSLPDHNPQVGFVTAASYAGALAAFLVSPAIIRWTGDWESVFYIFGWGSTLLLPAWLLVPLGSGALMKT